MITSDFAYAQARIQARYGERADRAVWQTLHAMVELPALLEQARATPLRRWIQNISASTPDHEIERLMRGRLRAFIDEVAHWVPRRWRNAVRWTEVLMLIPAIAHLLRGDAAHPWMRDEPLLRALAETEPAQREAVLAQGELGALAAPAAGATFTDRWLTEWHRRWPACSRTQHAALRELVDLVRTHDRTFAAGETVGARTRRRAFEMQVIARLRRGFHSALAVFSGLLLAAIEIERLRGALAARAHFAPGTR